MTVNSSWEIGHRKDSIMILGMTLATFTTVHVILSLIGIVAGLVVVFGMLQGRMWLGWTHLFLLTTVLTSLTGYLFPAQHVMPSHIVGAISLVALAIAMLAIYGRGLVGGWRRTFVVSAVVALYLNAFVLVVQSFEKIPVLHALAPKGSEPPFAVAQLIVLAFFTWIGFQATKRFRTDAVHVMRERRAA
jgi:hypothetical protein